MKSSPTCQVVLQDPRTKRLTLHEYTAPEGSCIDQAEVVALAKGLRYVTCARLLEP